MDNKTITVKGVGNVKMKVDYVVVNLELSSIHKDYDEVMEIESQKLNMLMRTIVECGFPKTDIKTNDFRVNAKYKNVEDENRRNYKEVFVGYQCDHKLKISFDYDTSLLNKVLSAISKSEARPKINISFTVKDQNKMSNELLKTACEDAQAKANILCTALGYKRGSLLKIDYNWAEIYFESDTSLATPSFLRDRNCSFSEIDIEPEDIEATDTAVFIWEII